MRTLRACVPGVAKADDRDKRWDSGGVLGPGHGREAWRAAGRSAARAADRAGCREPGREAGRVHRRGAVHRMPRPGEQAFQRDASCEGLPAESEERHSAAGLRSLPRAGLESRQERARQDRAHRVHQALGNAGGRAEWPVPELPRGWRSPALAGFDAREEQPRLRGLPQSHAEGVGQCLLARQSVSETCYQCHKQQRAEFRKRSHMPLPEGKMSCVDCHNPHGSTTRSLLNADSVNDVCYTCHAEKRGPFLWEHAPVRESCINCHKPHGSNHDKLLVGARPYLCQQCHNLSVGHNGTFYRDGQTAAGALQGGGQSPRVIGRTCQNCHSQIHGSNHPAGARFQR